MLGRLAAVMFILVSGNFGLEMEGKIFPRIKKLGKAGFASDKITFHFIAVELDLSHKFISKELARYDWLKSSIDRNSDAVERLEEDKPYASESPANNLVDFELEQNSSTNSETTPHIVMLKPPLTPSVVLNQSSISHLCEESNKETIGHFLDRLRVFLKITRT
jgi:hypothetical protein